MYAFAHRCGVQSRCTLPKLVHIEAQVKGLGCVGFYSIMSAKVGVVFGQVSRCASLGVLGRVLLRVSGVKVV